MYTDTQAHTHMFTQIHTPTYTHTLFILFFNFLPNGSSEPCLLLILLNDLLSFKIPWNYKSFLSFKCFSNNAWQARDKLLQLPS